MEAEPAAQVMRFLVLPLLILLHAGFVMRHMGMSRQRNALDSGVGTMLAFAFVLPAFCFVGWWLYHALPTGLSMAAGPGGRSGAVHASAVAWPWAGAAGPDAAGGAGAMLAIFALTGVAMACILAGATIERIRGVALALLALVLGGVVWPVAAAWGWHGDGWLVRDFGYRDFGAVGALHIVAGFFAFGVLVALGPRIGRYNIDGTSNRLEAHDLPLALGGQGLVAVGFFGFLLACAVLPGGAPAGGGVPPGPSILLAMAGGMIGAWTMTRDPAWLLSGALAGMVSCSGGLDLFWPPVAFVVAFAGGAALRPVSALLGALGIDDAAGSVAVHGIVGLWGALAVGLLAASAEGVSLAGQGMAGGVMACLGFLPGLLCALVLRLFGLLRVPEFVERAGLDEAGLSAAAYPENTAPSRRTGT